MRVLAIVIELLGIAAISVGIGIEMSFHASVGWFVISIGSLLIAAGSIIWAKFMRGG